LSTGKLIDHAFPLSFYDNYPYSISLSNNVHMSLSLSFSLFLSIQFITMYQ